VLYIPIYFATAAAVNKRKGSAIVPFLTSVPLVPANISIRKMRYIIATTPHQKKINGITIYLL